MSRYTGPAIRGERPWDSAKPSVDEPKELAPRVRVPYTCDKDHRFFVTLAFGVTPPAAWTCKCGAKAYLNPADKQGNPDFPGYNNGTGSNPHKHEDVTPWGQLMKRRSVADLELMLEERLAEVRGTGVAR